MDSIRRAASEVNAIPLMITPKNITLYWLTPFHTPYMAEVIGNPGGTILQLKERIENVTKGWRQYHDGKVPAGAAEIKRDFSMLEFYCPSPETYRAPLSNSAFPPGNLVFIVSTVGRKYLDLLDPVWRHVCTGFVSFSKTLPELEGVILPEEEDDDDDDNDNDDDDDEVPPSKTNTMPKASVGRDHKPVAPPSRKR